ncbi:MAG: hypothetical protein A2Y62_01485 [Candidatus Fischerbacteria bacterium RBG_13_37_8]|uniref:Uncharacterized protein n=1 Tax=Candidatus Fischerbacteria bacterium RBG_13_37_8 TaxID=1817863 RepID=A0A1F5VTW3_9BACT|nr:MAG: hypothetical protein A2Y62_01485 [Candidatus Fischerbacteria bacterium RBG_13_37_8]
MALFDLYFYSGTRTESFFQSEILANSKVWLDGREGFFDRYFHNKSPFDKIRFVPIAQMPDTPESLESLPFIEAKIIEKNHARAKILINSIQTLGAWARTISLSFAETIDSLPEILIPSPELFSTINEQISSTGYYWWKSDKPLQRIDELRLLCVFQCIEEIRCLFLTTNAVPSHLVTLTSIEDNDEERLRKRYYLS